MFATPVITPACFGIACSRHGECARYAAVDGSRADPHTLVTCTDGHGYPMFLRRIPVCSTAHRHAGALSLA